MEGSKREPTIDDRAAGPRDETAVPSNDPRPGSNLLWIDYGRTHTPASVVSLPRLDGIAKLPRGRFLLTV